MIYSWQFISHLKEGDFLLKLLKRLEGLCRNEFERTRFAINEDEDWLKSLKDKVQPQPKQEWSEEDEYFQAFIMELLYGIEDDDKEYESKCRKAANWLKSLRPQTPINHWKPSDEQMEFLQKYAEQNNYDGSILTSLYNDLKKIKE